MPVFDFHCHPGMKARLAPAGQEPSPWTSIKVTAEILHSIKIGISPLFADSLDSQASFKHLLLGGVNLIGLIIHSIESQVASGLLEMSIVRNGRILQLSPGKLQAMADGDKYYKIVKEELKGLTDFPTPDASMGLPQDAKFKFIRSMSEYKKDDMNTVHAILILEGSQNLFDNYNDADFKEQFFRNLDDLTSKFRLFAINPCHFQQQPIANHAFAMQVLKNIAPFYPVGRGITPFGKDAILELYKRNINVDIKHMGLLSRIHLYTLRSDNDITIPLICSHAGVAGISWDKRLNYFYHESPQDEGLVWKISYMKKWGHVAGTAYNMASLQLYDEDIEIVIASGGMIGVSLDQRIIGFPADDPLSYQEGIYPTDIDYISKNEADTFFGPNPPSSLKPGSENNSEVMDFSDAENQNAGDVEELHALYFLNQVLHILWVGKNNQKGITVQDAMRSICIGSDLDGLVNAIDCCRTTAEYPDFKNRLLSLLNKKSFWKNTGFKFGEIDRVMLLDGIFFNNAEEFLKKNFV